MFKICLTNRLVNAIAKRFISKYIAKKLGTDGLLTINELYAVEENGRVVLKFNAELDLSTESAEILINKL